MGARINYELVNGRLLVALLFSNSHHDTEVPLALFQRLVTEFGSKVTSLLEQLLLARYQVTCRGHQAGDRVFAVDLCPGDRELVVRVDFAHEPPKLTLHPILGPEALQGVGASVARALGLEIKLWPETAGLPIHGAWGQVGSSEFGIATEGASEGDALAHLGEAAVAAVEAGRHGDPVAFVTDGALSRLRQVVAAAERDALAEVVGC
ncbi:hypothetical protein [Ottowia sp.]|uniref:hypothetical protein n=1 Tax=Ottowia sp. TaxID=1898956 RepID=UPI0025D99E5E|nr:hypothetical protein [Ottowia sp.]MBK6616376.1 hypothetical protein [Ottowia sp.]